MRSSLRALRSAPKDNLLRRVARRALNQRGLARRILGRRGLGVPLFAARRAVSRLGLWLRHGLLLARRRDLRPAWVGRAWVVSREVEPCSIVDAMRTNLDAVVDVLEAVGIPYFLTKNRTPNRFQVGVDAEHRRRLLALLAERYAAEGLYLAATGTLREQPTTRLVGRGGPVFRWRARRASLWRVYWAQRMAGSRLVLGATHACDVEFWEPQGPDRIAHHANAVTALLPGGDLEETRPAVARIGDRGYETIRAFTSDLVDDVTFPVDVVYTWVDGNDPAWQHKKEAVLADLTGDAQSSESTDLSRYHNRDELRYSMRSLWMFADFVRRVYLVTDDQIPEWLDVDHPDLVVVDHREIFGTEGRLPTFNSHAIETRLHHIDGLAEHYVYMNDDVFFGRRIPAATFFLSNGISKFFLSKARILLGPATADDPTVDTAAKNNRALLHARFGQTITQKLKHTPHPQRRSVLFEMEQEFADEVKRTAGSQFRSAENISFASSLHHYYAYLTGRAVAGEIRYDYFNTTDWNLERRLEALTANRSLDAFCLNDTDLDGVDLEAQHRMLQSFLAEYYPCPSPFEKG